MTTNQKIISWFLTGNVGTSSEAIVAQMTDNKTGRDGLGDHPHDNSDFGRCYKLLEAVPEFKSRIGEMSPRSPEWAALIARWDELIDAWVSRGDDGEQFYQLIRSILDAVPNKRRVSIGDGVTIYPGKDT